MTAQTDTLAGAVRPTVAPPAPESPAAAHFHRYAAAHGPSLRARSRRAVLHTMLGLLAVAVMLLAIVGLFALLSPAEQHLFAGAGILTIVGAFVAVSILATRHARPAPTAPTVAPSPCICGNAPTLRQLSGGWWWIGCAPPCDDALCAVGNTPEDARATWENVMIEARQGQG